jgi:hypothetical protein
LGSHSQVLESGQGLGWFYLALNPKTKLASTLLLEAIATRTSGMVSKYLRNVDGGCDGCRCKWLSMFLNVKAHPTGANAPMVLGQ